MRQVSAAEWMPLPCHVLACCTLPCHHLHVISIHHVHCIAYVFVLCIRAFSPLSVLQFDTPMSSSVPFYLFSCVGIKLSRNGPRFVKRPWYSTGRPPVKFRVIRRSFDTPTANQVAVKASCVLQPKTPSNKPNNPSKTLPCPSPFDHDRVAENRAQFGAP